MASGAGLGGFGAGAVRRIATRLKYPQLLALTATLFAVDLFMPDLVPFIDEILLGLATTLFATWRERVVVDEQGRPVPGAKPPEKNVTPPG